ARGTDALDLAASYGTDKLRAMVVTVHDRLRSLGRRPDLPPIEPPRDTGQRERFLRAAAVAQRELAPHAGEGVTVDRALARLEQCEEVLASADPDPAELAKLAAKGGTTRALLTPAFQALAEAHPGYLAYCDGRRASAASRRETSSLSVTRTRRSTASATRTSRCSGRAARSRRRAGAPAPCAPTSVRGRRCSRL